MWDPHIADGVDGRKRDLLEAIQVTTEGNVVQVIKRAKVKQKLKDQG